MGGAARWGSTAAVLASLMVAGCASERAARSPSGYFDSSSPAGSARDASERPVAAASAGESERGEQPDDEDKDARLAREACACISRSATVRSEITPEGVRLVFRPYDRSDLERLERRVDALEEAAATDACELPGLMNSAEDVDIDVVDGAVQVELTTSSRERWSLRNRARRFARDVATYGVVSPEGASPLSDKSRR